MQIEFNSPSTAHVQSWIFHKATMQEIGTLMVVRPTTKKEDSCLLFSVSQTSVLCCLNQDGSFQQRILFVAYYCARILFVLQDNTVA